MEIDELWWGEVGWLGALAEEEVVVAEVVEAAGGPVGAAVEENAEGLPGGEVGQVDGGASGGVEALGAGWRVQVDSY